VVTDYLSNTSDEEISVETADWLAQLAGTLAKRLTAQWESDMGWYEINDQNIEKAKSDAHRQNSTIDLFEPFEPFICDDCARQAEQVTLSNFQTTSKNLVQ
jgi:hypothetical protein